MIVSTAGFTRQAREFAKEHGIDLLEFADLEQKVAGVSLQIVEEADRSFEESEARSLKARQPRAFVVMPFAPEFEDIYILGIRDVALKIRCRASRQYRTQPGYHRSSPRED